jgi:hypothetical protein
LSNTKANLSIFVGNSAPKPKQRYREHGQRYSLPARAMRYEQCLIKHGQCHRLNNVIEKIIHANDKSAQCNRRQAKKMPETT